MCIIDCLSTIVFILPLHLDYTKVIILILWWRNFQLEYWRTFQLVSTQYTPQYAVLPILKYLPKKKIIWCPFDTAHSEYVIALKEAGFKVIHSHIETGQDFFEYEPTEWDIIVSNPPFSIKKQILERCLSFNKPFALLLTNLWLNSSAPCRLFKEIEMQILLFDKRIQFTEKNGVYFNSSYFCYKILPKQIIFEELRDSKYLQSRMHEDMEKLIKPLMKIKGG